MRSSGIMLRSERAARPLVWAAVLWCLGVWLASACGLPLRTESGAEIWLKEKADGYGTVRGTLCVAQENGSGNYTLTLENAAFTPRDGSEALSAGTVLVYFPFLPDCAIGDTAAAQGELELIRPADNPGGFDARSYYLARDTACMMEADTFRVEEASQNSWAASAAGLKQWLREGLKSVCFDEDAAVLSAMLLGSRGDVPAETEKLYETAGISHLLSVSGLHVSLVAGLFLKLFGFLLSFLPYDRLKSRAGPGLFLWLRNLLAGGAVLFYMELAGGRVPLRRAGLMFLLLLASQLFRKSYDLPSALAAAALSVLIPSPLMLFQASFQLSFGCVIGIGVLFPMLQRFFEPKTAAGRAVLLPISLQFVILPITLTHYYCFYPYQLIANLIVIPFAFLLLAGGFFTAFSGQLLPLAGRILAGSVHILLKGIEALCAGIRRLPFHTVVLGKPFAWQTAAFYLIAAAGLLWMRAIRKKQRDVGKDRWLPGGKRSLRRAGRELVQSGVLLVWLLAAAVPFALRADQALTITSLYVGQGDCHIIRTPAGHCYMIDAGSSYGDPAEKHILPYLRYAGTRRLEAVLASHLDEDHTNALTSLMEEESLAVDALILPMAFRFDEKAQALLTKAQARQIPVFWIADGAAWEDGACRFSVLYPFSLPVPDAGNNDSMVLQLCCGAFQALFPGDLEASGEAALLAAHGEELAGTDYLKVGHHGSKTSSSEAFLAALGSRYAVISCGRNNMYGHPSAEVTKRLAAFGTEAFRTDTDGAVTLTIEKEGSITARTCHESDKENSMKEEDSRNKLNQVYLGIGILALVGVVILAALIVRREQKEEPGRETERLETAVKETDRSQSEPPQEMISSREAVLPAETRTEESGSVTAAEGVSPLDNAGRGALQEDPRMPGYFFDPEATDELYLLFASENTNNTDETSRYRSLSAAFKARNDTLCLRFANELTEASLLEAMLLQADFSWPDEPAVRHRLKNVKIAEYHYGGHDMEVVKERILFTNISGRHYLFLQVFCSEEENAVHVIMVNGMIY